MRKLSELNHIELSQEVADEIQKMAMEIATMARQLASVHRNFGDVGTANRFAKVALEFSMQTMMEVLGNLLNGLDAVDFSDAERSGEIFDELRRRFPADRDYTLDGAAQAVRLISELGDRRDDASYRAAVIDIISKSGFAKPMTASP